jgi:hypothetical protein
MNIWRTIPFNSVMFLVLAHQSCPKVRSTNAPSRHTNTLRSCFIADKAPLPEIILFRANAFMLWTARGYLTFYNEDYGR